MNSLNSLKIIFNLKSIILSAVSVGLTFLCLHYDFIADLPLTLLGIAVVFPIVFSISEAYKRRESTLAYYGNLKAHGRALFFACRDWIDTTNEQDLAKMKLLIFNILQSIKILVQSRRKDVETHEKAVYDAFSEMSKYIIELRAKGLPSGEASRANQYISKMLDAFENMKHIFQYRTPRALRDYSKIFIYTTPIIYAPYLAKISKDLSLVLVIITPILLTTMLVGLDYIQDKLENPFDEDGEDDVKINPEKFIAGLEKMPK